MDSDLVAVIDYGMGNLHSVASALERAGAGRVAVSREREVIRTARRIVFPGVGAMRDCMGAIRRLQCDEMLREALAEKRQPVLAICVGYQALLDASEENGGVECLGLVPGAVRRFKLAAAGAQTLKVPHIGWSRVQQQCPHPLWAGIEQGSRFYFVHSYYCDGADKSLVAGSTRYGIEFDAALARDNLFATQFHPEKSHKAGLRLLENFLGWDGQWDGHREADGNA